MDFKALKNNADILRSILSANKDDIEALNDELDKLLNTTKITYKSRQDYLDNFPTSDDIGAKVKLILNRLQ